ncbi:MAG: hypothetical protein KGQ93_10880 [Cyanobacteria bacterium REEB459]|nr:hypothetical protein [Cyanobacteria bacterium REEB459]
MTILFSLFVIGWVAVALIGTQAYFRGEQSKPIHERNWRSNDFDQLAESITGRPTDFGDRVAVYSGDAFSSTNL